MSSEKVQIGKRICKVRKSLANMSQTDFAKWLQVSQRSISHWENGGGDVRATALVVLYYEGVNINWLLTGEGHWLRNSDGVSGNQTVAHEPGSAEARLEACRREARRLRDVNARLQKINDTLHLALAAYGRAGLHREVEFDAEGDIQSLTEWWDGDEDEAAGLAAEDEKPYNDDKDE